jgi:Arm DNA-binding domain
VARMIEKLTPAAVRNETRAGLYGDGAGLYLHVGPDATERTGKSWIYRFMLNGKAREMGLGPLHAVGLSEARQRAQAARRMRLDGIDPLAARDALKAAARLDAAATMTLPGTSSLRSRHGAPGHEQPPLQVAAAVLSGRRETNAAYQDRRTAATTEPAVDAEATLIGRR